MCIFDTMACPLVVTSRLHLINTNHINFLIGFFMRLNIKNALIALILVPCIASAASVGSYFQQGVIIQNTSAQSIMVTDAAIPELTNKEIQSGHELVAAFASDQFTVAAGQTFSHTYSIHSATNFALICTVTSNIVISTSGLSMNKPANSDETHCQAGNAMVSSKNGTILATGIIVS
jgi:hypothetical protein